MKTILFLTLLALAAAAGKSLVREYFAAIKKFGSSSSTSLKSGNLETQKKQFLSFKSYKNQVDAINADDSIPFNAETNKFSILTDSERQQYLGINMTAMNLEDDENVYMEPVVSSGSCPDHVNWVSRAAQPAIKNQAGCGSCWAFAATSAIEASYYITTGDLVTFSDQEILDCSYEGWKGWDGCNGGWLDAPVDYVKKNNRLAPLSANGYKGRDGSCAYADKTNALTKAKVAGYRSFSGDSALKSAVARGVVSVAIYIGNSFFMYKSGIYSDTKACTTTTTPNHAVTVVGYGEQNGELYWRVRNSWGENWGDKGYIKMSRDVKDNCRIASYGYLTVTVCSGGDCSPYFADLPPDFADEEEQEEEVCEDVVKPKLCQEYSPHCEEGSKYYDWTVHHCKSTCKLCDEEEQEEEQEEEGQEETAECEDVKPKLCQKYSSHCEEGSKYYDWAAKNCKSTCKM